ncbi:unnamed protein product [Prunus armeniaca]|uniref:Uncharacterized protein n=1 Tax=Prunus armeniaca TaxID=36596 RepID=A0A6J5Y8G1_PRUAR|nr:unnamed protein product [Prunus armeniaca]
MAHGTSLMAISLKPHNFSFPHLTTMILVHPTLTMHFGFNNINLSLSHWSSRSGLSCDRDCLIYGGRGYIQLM